MNSVSEKTKTSPFLRILLLLPPRVGLLTSLCKVEIAVFAALSCVTGYVMAVHHLSTEIVLPAIGIFVLACGGGALNQYQERLHDALMERTKNRPIPSGKISPARALIIAVFLMGAGFLLLFLTAGLASWGLAVFAIVWYNGFYTYYKRRSAFAVVPGALIGTVPPMVGWAVGGGGAVSPVVLVMALFFYVWQVPHFGLIFLGHENEYKTAGFPTLSGSFTVKQIARMTFVWIVAAALACLFLSLATGQGFFPINVVMLGLTVWLVWNAVKLLMPAAPPAPVFKKVFRQINMYMFFVLLLLLAGSWRG